MARWILITLMLLLPLRDWAGAFMPIHAMPQGGAPHAAHAQAQHRAQAAAQHAAPCPMHAAMGQSSHSSHSVQAADGDEAATTAGGCEHCQLCQANASLPHGAHWGLLPLALAHGAARPSVLHGLALSPDHPPPIAPALI